MPDIQIHHDPGTSRAALYVDGLLAADGPYTTIVNAALDLAGIVVESTAVDPPFLGGGREPLATLDEVDAYRAAVAERNAEIERLRREAEIKLDAAAKLAVAPVKVTPEMVAEAAQARAAAKVPQADIKRRDG